MDNDIVKAFKACLDPDYPQAPTKIQKAIVLKYITDMGRTGTNMYEQGLSANDLFCREGMRIMALNIVDITKRDPLEKQQERAITSGPRRK